MGLRDQVREEFERIRDENLNKLRDIIANDAWSSLADLQEDARDRDLYDCPDDCECKADPSLDLDDEEYEAEVAAAREILKFWRKEADAFGWDDQTPWERWRETWEVNEPKGDPRFHALLKQIGDLHDKKQADYGRTNDPFANVRASEDFGVAPWVGAMIRANDKMRRLQTAARGSTLANEGVEDSLMDLAVYALIALVLFREGDE